MNKKFKQILLIILMSSMVLSSGGFLDLITLGGTVYASGGDKAAAAIEEESSGSSVQEESASGDAKGSDTSADKAGDNSGASDSDSSKASGEQSSDKSGKADGSEKSDKADAKSDDAAQGNADKANADGTKAQDSKAAKDKAADKDSKSKQNKDKAKLKYQKLKATPVQAPLYKTGSKNKKGSAEVKRVRRFWKSLTGRKVKAEDNNKTGSKSPVKLVIAGDLPKGATADATYIEYDEKDIYNEQILTAFDITIRDKDGKVYIPKTPVSITVKGKAVESATDEGAAVLIYSCVPDKERTASYKEKYGIKYAADVLVYRDGTGDDARREYKVYKKNKTYKDGKDAVRYREDKAGLSYDDESTIVFDYTYGKNTGKQAKAKDTAGTLHFVMSQQLPQEVIDANLEAKAAAEAEADAEAAKEESTDSESADGESADKDAKDAEIAYDEGTEDGWIVDDLEEDDDAETAGTAEKADSEKSGSGSDKAAAEDAEKAKDGEEKGTKTDESVEKKDSETADSKDAKAEAGTEAGEKEDGKDKTEEKAAESGAVSEDPASSAKTDKIERTATDGMTYKVTATYETGSGIPDNAELIVKEIRKGEFGYKSYVNRSAEEVGKDPEELGFVKLLDISFKDPITGLEYQPDDKVIVNIELLKNDVSESSDVDVVHFGDKKVEVMDSEVKDGAVEFEAEGFSVYVLMGTAGIEEEPSSGSSESTSTNNNSDLLTKELKVFNGNLASYKITINSKGTIMNDGNPLTLKDTFSKNQSILYSTINVNAGGYSYSYDYSGQTGTFTIPDGIEVIIEYKTRVKGSAGTPVEIRNTAELGVTDNNIFTEMATYSVTGSETITPTGTDTSGQSGVYTIDLFVYPESHMEEGLEDAVFRLLDSNMKPMKYKAGDNAGKEITFKTNEKGHVDIKLDKSTDGLTLHKNTLYYLEMITAPFEYKDGDYVYYQKDNTYYSFIISDEPSYEYGDFYVYYNGDTLKVRCYPEAPGVNITKRFSGNYSLNDEQKNAICFTLQKERPGTTSGWEDIESHTYKEFSYGSINFNIGKAGGEELEDNATYRIIEENALPEELKGIIEEDVSVSVSYQMDGRPIEADSNEFTVDPDDKLAKSYDFTFTNNYIDHKLTIIKINEKNGNVLQNAVFTVYEVGDSSPVATYTTDEEGAITIRKGDTDADYDDGKLYYAVETAAPEGYILPKESEREKVYFYFSGENDTAPAALPSDITATDLTKSYNTVTLSNDSTTVDVPVTVIWGLDGSEAWPDSVNSIDVGLYKSVDGGAPEKVTDRESGDPRTLTLTKNRQYDNSTFVDLPAIENGKPVEYSVVEEKITGENNSDITDQYSNTVNVSGTGWHVIKNQPALSVTVKKEWYGLDGEIRVSNVADKPEISFDLYRTTKESSQSNFTRAELTAFLSSADRVRSGLKLNNENDWSMDVRSLQMTDDAGHPYYYYALEHIPDNQEDSYIVAEATESQQRVLTIKNRQTPITVTIKANDIEKVYGDTDPQYDITAEVMDDDSSVTVSGENGNYIATVKDGKGDTHDISFTVSREAGKNVGKYTITPSGDASQHGYRVLFETGILTINRAQVKITAGASKPYGDEDPALVSIEGLKNDESADDVLRFKVSREEGEDAGDYEISLTGEEIQGNYTVKYVRRDENGNPYVFTITRAKATVTADDKNKFYGEDDPEFTATVTGLKNDDEPSVITYDLTREQGEDARTYVIIPDGESTQGNYDVTYNPGTLTINKSALTIKVEDAEKTYGDPDPEWEIDIDGLQEEGEISSTLDESTGIRTYTYSVEDKDGNTGTLLTFTAKRDKAGEKAGENVGEYKIILEGENEQGNYNIIKFKPGTLTIERAELIVTADDKVKAIGVQEDPLLTATITGWQNGDDDDQSSNYSISQDGTVTWTYAYAKDGIVLLQFTLKRDVGEDEVGEEEGEYRITASGEEKQSNYRVNYEPGIFGIRSVVDVDITQPLVDDADSTASPSFNYTATLDLTGTGMTEYNKNGFTEINGVPTMSFTLPDTDEASMKTLKVPGGAKLTVRQDTVNDDYITTISVDKEAYTNPSDPLTYKSKNIETYHEIAFKHSRISLPVEARAASGTDESGAVVLEGRKGAMGIPTAENNTRSIDAGFADEMHSKIGYVLPTDKYYVYDHATLYRADGSAVEGASHVRQIRYDRGNSKWQYSLDSNVYGNFIDVTAGDKLVLFYVPKSVCKIDTVKFDSLKEAVTYAVENETKTATIQMLIDDYSIRNAVDAVTIPEGYNITITTPGPLDTDYDGTTRPATISRSMSYTDGFLFTNNGTLTFEDIILDGKKIASSAAMINNATVTEKITYKDADGKDKSYLKANEIATLNLNSGATIRNAKGANGGAIYVEGGSVTINGTLTGNTATNGGVVYMDNKVYKVGGENKNSSLEINSGNIDKNMAQNGGIVYMSGGEININAVLESTNSADKGGAIYMTGGTLNIDEDSALQNSAAVNGGAVYMTGGVVNANGTLSSNTFAVNGGAVYMAGGTFNGNGTLNSNTAVNGGAVYMTGGTFNGNGTLNNNTADKGGGVYLSNGTLLMNGGQISNNNAHFDGGAVYASSGNISIQNGALINNTAAANGGALYSQNANINIGKKNNTETEPADINIVINENSAQKGAAIYVDSASVEIAAGTVSNNTATEYGGAIYVNTGKATCSGGSISGNTAVNGSAIFAYKGIGNILTEITGNIASIGGAVGVGSDSASLYFKEEACVKDNYLNDGENNVQSNVYLDVDSDKVINADADTLKDTNIIGIYVPDGANLAKHGDIGGYFGAYSTNKNVNDPNLKFPVLEQVFKNDRFEELESKYENNRLYWGAPLTYDVVYKASFDADEPPKKGETYNATSGDGYKQITLNQTCYPHGTDGNVYQIYDLVNSLDLYNKNKSNFDKQGAGAASVYAYTYANSQENQFDSGLSFSDYITAVRWDTASRKWKFVKQDGTFADVDSADRRIVIIYSAPAYISITNNNGANKNGSNNNEPGFPLEMSLTVNGRNAGKTHYGYATAKNGATVSTLTPLTEGDLKLNDGESVKILIPGAAGKGYTLKGTFEGAGDNTQISYTINGETQQTITGSNVSIEGRTLPSGYNTEEIVFGTALPICKIGEETFPTLKRAVEYMEEQEGRAFKVEMLVDYLIPSTDVLEIPRGYQVTFTTSQDRDFRGAGEKDADGNVKPTKRAILSRDFGNMGSSVILDAMKNTDAQTAMDSGSTLNVTNLIFDGRAVAGTGNGGAISTRYCDVTIDNCTFKGYQATRGGAIFVVRGGNSDQNAQKDEDGEPVGGLKVYNSTFENCKSSAAVDKAGGGAVWTTAKGLVMKNCTLTDCACTGGSAQGGSIFHNIVDGDYSKPLQYKEFDYDSANASYVAGYSANTMSLFENLTFNACYSLAGAGGAIETDAQDTVMRGCKFYSCYTNSKGGGGAVIIYARDKAEPEEDDFGNPCPCSATISGCEFYNSKAEGVSEKTWGGGAIRTTTRDTTISNCKFRGASTSKNGGAVCISNGHANSLNLTGCVFEDCEAKSGSGGAVYCPVTNLIGANNSGETNSFINCTASDNGGGVYQPMSTYFSGIGQRTKQDGTIEEYKIYSNNSLHCNLENLSFESCTARTNNGGGLYTVAKELSIDGGSTSFLNCTAQNEGGGIYHDRRETGGIANISGTVSSKLSFTSCKALTGAGGAIRTNSKTVIMTNLSVTGCQAVTAGGGVYINPSDDISRIKDCSFTNNTLSGSTGNGGGVSVGDGNGIIYYNSTISNCSAVNGGGWYQKKARLYILGGAISGSATTGGGLYVYGDGNNRVYHYSGNITGTATGNGGGVYLGAGEYNLKREFVDEFEYSGATIGSVSIGEQGQQSYTATAGGDGGGLYQDGGTLNVGADASIAGSATGNGGGVYSKNTVNQTGGDITGEASNGGGVYKTTQNHYNFSGGAITGTATGNGGAVYHDNNQFNLSGDAVIGDPDGTSSSATNGGGMYLAGGSFNMTGEDCKVAGAEATQDGGGVFVAGGTFTFKKGSIVRNTATRNGGGVYHGGGTFSMTTENNATSCGKIGGSSENGNTADKGGGIFVADGQKATFNDGASKTLEISHNHAETEGGGIAVGGTNAVLTFENAVTVRNNTMGANNTECNVYLEFDSNTIIQNKWLDKESYIGVYVDDSESERHGTAGKPFATYSNDTNFDVYHNDRTQYLTGTKGNNKLVKWSEFVCKITDGEGNLLYKNATGSPAVYGVLGNNGATGAFSVLNVSGNANLYTRDGFQYTDKEFQVQMLVQNYPMTERIQLDKIDKDKTITLTTASIMEDECGLKYIGDYRRPATVIRQKTQDGLIWQTKGNLIFDKLIFDGGSNEGYESNSAGGLWCLEGEDACGMMKENAIFRNSRLSSNSSRATSGGAVYILKGATFNLNGGTIENCHTTRTGSSGGGVGIDNGTFTMNGGEITGCSAKNGGGVWMNNASKFYMNGGSITGNTATNNGGGIALSSNNDGSRIYFAGVCKVIDNTQNGVRCNVRLNSNTNTIINANASGIDSKSEIGIYAADGNVYNNHGESGDPFGTWSTNGDNLFCFINDRSQDIEGRELRGYQSANENDKNIYWEYHPLLTVTKTVKSDLSSDKDTEFTFSIKITGDNLDFSKAHNVHGDMDFNKKGIATVTLKDSGSKTAVLPDSFDKAQYEISEIPTEDQSVDYTTSARKDGETFEFSDKKPLTVTGQLGENIGTENSTSLSDVEFINRRETGNLVVSKHVVSWNDDDKNDPFKFKLIFDDTSINKTYTAVVQQENLTEFPAMNLSVENGETSFILRHGQSIRIKDLPTDLGYTVQEELDDRQQSLVRTEVSKDGSDSVYATSQTGKIGEKTKPEGDKTVYESSVSFINSFLEIVCKITNRSRELLYYRDTRGNLQKAIYTHLEDAFDQINKGGLRTSGNGTVSGQLRIEMVVPQYTMSKGATLEAGKTVLLSTALPTDIEHPYNSGNDDEHGNVSTVTRSFADGSMITDKGTLTIDKIILDGASTAAENAVKANTSGGIINVSNSARLNVNSSATLRNSSVSGDGGAVYISQGSSLVMNGTIDNCQASSGGGIFASDGFTTITTAGTITGCKAVKTSGEQTDGTAVATGGNGGAIYASTGTSLNLNDGTVFKNNQADQNGGAVYSDSNITLRGTIGGLDENTGNFNSNTAANEGGGIYMGSNTTFTMYAGAEISGNRSLNGGGIAAHGTTRIAGGSIKANTAALGESVDSDSVTDDMIYGAGGAVYASDSAVVTVSGTADIRNNNAQKGGAVYNGGDRLEMTGGIMTDNIAYQTGGAVYVVDGKKFSMSGGTIETNKSPKGAVSTGENSILDFSGNAIIINNTSLDGNKIMNVFLGYDINSIITTSGLGRTASIGIYVTDGPNNQIYNNHGLSARNFGTYTGDSIRSARLNEFVNDRDNSLTGVNGGVNGDKYFIAWSGKGLQLKVLESDTGTKDSPVAGVTLVLINSDEKQVWSGKSGADGSVAIPWTGDEKENGNAARFAPKSTYTLEEIEASGNTVRSAGKWNLEIGQDDSLTWRVVSSERSHVNRTISIIPSDPEVDKAKLGEVCILYNDVEPSIKFDANGGKLSDNNNDRTDVVKFEKEAFNQNYQIKEANAYWDSHVFKCWATLSDKPEVKDPENEAQELKEAGYFEYTREDHITFYRGTDKDGNEQGFSNGDITLYAQWDEVVCKITDRDGKLLYVEGAPAVYGTLEEGFNAANTISLFTYENGRTAGSRINIEMLIGDYELNEAITVARKKNIMLTTAPSTDNDGYAYTGDPGTVCIITRGDELKGSMITNYANFTLMDIILDGRLEPVECSGGIVNNGGIGEEARQSAILNIAKGAVLQNSNVTGSGQNGQGGAVYNGDGNTVYMYDGTINGNRAVEGAGIYLAQGSHMYISGAPNFGGTGVIGTGDNSRLVMYDADNKPVGNFVEQDDYTDETQNGGMKYPKKDSKYYARQDIFIAGYSGKDEDKNAASLGVEGNVTAEDGSIWVWAESAPHYKMNQQFAKNKNTRKNGTSSLKVTAFRNAQDDALTENNTDGYLTAEMIAGDNTNIFWNGNKGSRRVILRKVMENDNGTFNPPTNTYTFTVYRGSSDNPVQIKLNDNNSEELRNLTTDSGGVFWVGDLPYDDYIIEEKKGNSIEGYFYLIIDKNGTTNMQERYSPRSEAEGAMRAEKENRESLYG